MEEKDLIVRYRAEKGKEEARRLRRKGLIPAVVYGHHEAPIPITLNPQDLGKVLRGGAGTRTLIKLTIEGLDDGTVTKTVILKDKQIDPIKRTLLHADLYSVTMDVEISVNVPIILVGKAKGVEMGGVLDQIIREIEIKCLPNAIPPQIELDVSDLTIGDNIHVGDITLEKGKIMTDPSQAVVAVVPPTVLKEEVVAEEEKIVEEVAEEKEEEAEEESEAS